MASQKTWALKGVFYECCRMEGHCPLWFGRDLWEKPCANLATHEIKEGQIDGIDMKGIIVIYFQDGIGPKASDVYSGNGIKEGAVYISDNASAEQRSVLEPFVKVHLYAEVKWQKTKILGVKYVKIEISKDDSTYHVVMPFGEQQLNLTVGGDMKTPIRMENPKDKTRSNVVFCNADLWKYNDYGRNLEFHNTCGAICDFATQGNL